MEAKELENGAKMEPKVSLRRVQGGQMEAKEFQNGGKMEPQEPNELGNKGPLGPKVLCETKILGIINT